MGLFVYWYVFYGGGGGGKGGERGNIQVAISLRAVQGISHRKEFCLKLSPLKPWIELNSRSSFYHPSRCEESQERGNHEPLVSLRRPGSAEQVQLKKKETQKKKESGLMALFLFFNNKMEHPHVKCSLLLLIVLVTSKLAPTKLLSDQKFMWQVTNTT